MDLLEYEKELYKQGVTLIAGTDEVGRGPLCGPVVAAACILPVGYKLDGLNDSKKLTEKQRNKFYDILIKDCISYAVGVVSPQRIDEINILNASKEAMMIALSKLDVNPKHVLIDAVKLDIDIPSTSIIKGDAKSLTIAAASVIAKVTRDNMMYELDKKYPMYGYAKHKGYPTKLHIENIKKYGVLDFYRRTFSPIKEIIENVMTKKDILDKLDNLQLDKNEYIVISGSSLVLQNIIKSTKDIDLACSDSYYDKINWDTKNGAFDKEIKYKDCFEISNNLYYPNDYIVVSGYKCLKIDKILEIKKRLNRKKDEEIIKKLEKIVKK
jgi:ribonuclease HII